VTKEWRVKSESAMILPNWCGTQRSEYTGEGKTTFIIEQSGSPL